MTNVTRYGFLMGDLCPQRDGPYVEFEKYSLLLARLERMQKALKEAQGCLVVWRCWKCEAELHELPRKPFGPCPKCGMDGHGHKVFSDDREKLVAVLAEALEEKP